MKQNFYDVCGAEAGALSRAQMLDEALEFLYSQSKTRLANPSRTSHQLVSFNRDQLRPVDEFVAYRIIFGCEDFPSSSAIEPLAFRPMVLDPATRTAQARIELANPVQALKIGMFVNVVFAALGGAESTTPVISKTAVQNINNQQVVFVEGRTPNTYAMRPVKLGLRSMVNIRCWKA